MTAKHMQSLGNSCVLGALRRGMKWLALLVVLGSGPSVAQPAHAPTQRAFGEFLIINKNGDRIQGRSGSLDAARLTGVSEEGRQLDISRDDIQTLYLKEGSLAGRMALYGGGVGLAFSSLVLLRVGIDDPRFFQQKGAGTVSVALIGGSTALGALIGLAIGAGKSEWRVEPVVAPGQQYSLHLAGSL